MTNGSNTNIDINVLMKERSTMHACESRPARDYVECFRAIPDSQESLSPEILIGYGKVIFVA